MAGTRARSRRIDGVRILLDVNMSPLWCDYLRAAGHDAVHWSALGDVRADDTEIVAYARAHGFVIFTRDLDFGVLLTASGDARPSIIQFRGAGQLPAKIGPRVLHILQQAAPDLLTGAFISMDLNKTRLRIMPLSRQ